MIISWSSLATFSPISDWISLPTIESDGMERTRPMAGLATIALPSPSKTMTPSAMPSRIAWFLLHLACSRARAWARSLVLSSTRWSSSRFTLRRSSRAFSRLRAESQETRAMAKKPIVAIKFGTICSAMAIRISKTLTKPATTKLAKGRNKTLDIKMGMEKTKRVRPSTTCWGSSLKAVIRINITIRRELAIQPDQ